MRCTSDPAVLHAPQLYETVGTPLLASAMEGYNVAMFAYGQTGSGKTYSMAGTPDAPGIVPRFMEALFGECDVRNAAGGTTCEGHPTTSRPAHTSIGA